MSVILTISANYFPSLPLSFQDCVWIPLALMWTEKRSSVVSLDRVTLCVFTLLGNNCRLVFYEMLCMNKGEAVRQVAPYRYFW